MNSLTLKICPTFDAAEPYRSVWNRFAQDNPMLSWDWLSNWWFHLGATQRDARNRLMLVIVKDADSQQAVGIAPFYIEKSWLGRSLRFLGDQAACSDYVRVLAAPGAEQPIGRKLAQWLTSHEFTRETGGVDLLAIEGYQQHDATWQTLWQELQVSGWRLDETALESSWLIPLEKKTLEQVQRQGRDSLRRKCKRLLKMVDNSEIEMECVDSQDHFDQVWPEFVRLHQKRRSELGQPGCFSSQPFERFLQASIRQLTNEGQARLWFATRLGIRFAALLTLQSDSRIFVYQSGMDSAFSEFDPGHLMNAYLIRWAHQKGLRGYDFLRGDEPYKRHIGAEPLQLFRARLIAPQWQAKAKDGLHRLARKTKQQSVNIFNWLRSAHTAAPSDQHVSD